MQVKQVVFPLPEVITKITEKDFLSRVVRQDDSTFIVDRSIVIVLGSAIIKVTDKEYNLELWLWGSYTEHEYINRQLISESYYTIKGRLESEIGCSDQNVLFHFDGTNERAENPRIQFEAEDSWLSRLVVIGDIYSRVENDLKKYLSL